MTASVAGGTLPPDPLRPVSALKGSHGPGNPLVTAGGVLSKHTLFVGIEHLSW